MVHLKRYKAPTSWPIPRKGTTFVVKPISAGIPLLIVLRDMLKIVQNRREFKRAIHLKQILLNTKEVKDDKQGATLFDTITIVPSKKAYKISLSNHGKFDVVEIKESEAAKKIAKVIDKKTLKGKKTQLNLSDGMNFVSDIKCNTNDSIVINLKEKKIEKCLSFKDKAKVTVIAGKHTGKTGEIIKIMPERKMASIQAGDDKINILIKQLMIIE